MVKGHPAPAKWLQNQWLTQETLGNKLEYQNRTTNDKKEETALQVLTHKNSLTSRLINCRLSNFYFSTHLLLIKKRCSPSLHPVAAGEERMWDSAPQQSLWSSFFCWLYPLPPPNHQYEAVRKTFFYKSHKTGTLDDQAFLAKRILFLRPSWSQTHECHWRQRNQSESQ